MAESAQDPEAPTTGETMRTERPQEGTLPIEQMQVSRAAEEAAQKGVEAVRRFGEIKSPEDLPESVKAVKGPENLMQPLDSGLGREGEEIFGMPGIPPELVAEFAALPPEVRAVIERQQQTEYTRGSWTAEIIRKTRSPEELVEWTREFVRQVEKEAELPDPHMLSQVRKYLTDFAAIYKRAAHPERLRESAREELARFGLVERKVQVSALQQIGQGIYRIDLTGEDKEKLQAASGGAITDEMIDDLEEGKFRVFVDNQVRQKLFLTKAGREILSKRQEEVLKAPPKGQLEKFSDTAEEMRQEIRARERILYTYVLYNRSAGLVEPVCQLFEDQRYSQIRSSEWQALFSAGPTLEDERPFGEKVDMAMRLYALIGLGGGPDSFPDGKKKTPVEMASDVRTRIEKELDSKPKTRELIQSLIRDSMEYEEFLGEIAGYASRNIFCDSPPYEEASRDEWVGEVRKFVRDIIGGNGDDTEAAEELGWRTFYLWGLATHFDGRKSEDSTVGWPGTDDRMKLLHFEKWRRREKDHEYGPDATMGKYDEMARQLGALDGKFSLAVSFMHWALPQTENGKSLKVGEMRTFWERWWNEGTQMKDLPWKSMRDYAWWNYNLGMYFAGGYRASSSGAGGNLLHLTQNDSWRRDTLIEIGNLRNMKRTVEYATSGSTITKGEIQEWLRTLPENKRQEIANYTGSQFMDRIVEPMRQRVRELLLIGAIASDYQTKGRVGSYLEWGILRPGNLRDLLQLKNVLIGLRLSAQDQGTTDEAARMVLKRVKYQLNKSKFDVNWDRVTQEIQSFLGRTGIEL